LDSETVQDVARSVLNEVLSLRRSRSASGLVAAYAATQSSADQFRSTMASENHCWRPVKFHWLGQGVTYGTNAGSQPGPA